jgi:hypothetical protein
VTDDTHWFAKARKRFAPVVLFLGLGFLIHETCQSQERRQVTLRLDLGPQRARVGQLWVDVFVDGESVAHYHRAAGAAGTPELRATLFGESAEVRIDLELAPIPPATVPERRVVTRRLHAEGGSTVTLPLADELAR